MTIVLADWIKDLAFMHSLCIHASYETSRPLSSTLSDVGHVCNSFDWAQSFNKLKRALTSIPVMCFLWKVLEANGFNLFYDCSSLTNKLIRALMGNYISHKMFIRWNG